jgi:outer membrane protein assembly factor BamD (BamD/ComL family)
MRNNFLLPILLILVLLSGCSPSKEKSVKNISGIEARLFAPSSAGFDRAKADSLLTAYESYVKHFPSDSLSLRYSFKAANLAMNMGDGAKAIDLFDKFISKYPDSPKASVSMFFKGYIYENQIKNLDKAKEIYLQFIEKYPTADFANDARIALKNLGKTPEQMVREFEEKQKEDSIHKADSIAALNPGKHKKKKK